MSTRLMVPMLPREPPAPPARPRAPRLVSPERTGRCRPWPWGPSCAAQARRPDEPGSWALASRSRSLGAGGKPSAAPRPARAPALLRVAALGVEAPHGAHHRDFPSPRDDVGLDLRAAGISGNDHRRVVVPRRELVAHVPDYPLFAAHEPRI